MVFGGMGGANVLLDQGGGVLDSQPSQGVSIQRASDEQPQQGKFQSARKSVQVTRIFRAHSRTGELQGIAYRGETSCWERSGDEGALTAGFDGRARGREAEAWPPPSSHGNRLQK